MLLQNGGPQGRPAVGFVLKYSDKSYGGFGMRFVIVLVLGGALALSGCGSDDDSEGSAGSGGTAGTGGTAGSSGAGGNGGAGGMNGGEAPVITMVAWAPDGACTPGTSSDFTVTVTATDADSDAMDLIYDGSVTGCAGDIDDATSTVTCPNAAPYGGTVVVSDGDGTDSDPVNFTIGVCETSSVTP